MDGTTRPALPTPDELLRSATAIRVLLDDTAADDHAARIRLVAAQDQVRLEAARQWRRNGWRPITESVVVPRRVPSLLVTPALTTLFAALGAVWWFGAPAWVAACAVLVGVAPLVAERRGGHEDDLRVVARLAAALLGVGVVAAPDAGGVLFAPAAVLLALVGLVGTRPRRSLT